MEETPWVISLIIAWLPFVFMIGWGVWIARRVGRSLRTPEGRSVGQVIEDCGRELKRSNDLALESIADLRARLEALEKQR